MKYGKSVLMLLAFTLALSLGPARIIEVWAQGTAFINQTIRIGSTTPYTLTWPAANAAGVVTNDGAGAVSFAATLPTAVQDNITRTGTVTSGTWSGSFGAVSGANLTSLNASNLASGTVPDARLAEVAWTDYGGISTITGWSSLTTQKIFYKKIGKTVFIAFQLEGTSNATTASFTLPHARSTDVGFALTFPLSGDIDDNGAAVTTNAFGTLASASSTVSTFKDSGGTAWTGSAGKRIAGQFFYEAAS